MDEIITQQSGADGIEATVVTVEESDAVDQAEVATEGTDEKDSGDTPLVAPLDLMAVVNRDVRAAHFLIDVINGCTADEALAKYFDRPVPTPDSGTLDEAERRGYLRGLNEKAEAEMNRPGAYEELRGPQSPTDLAGTPLISAYGRRSVWDID